MNGGHDCPEFPNLMVAWVDDRSPDREGVWDTLARPWVRQGSAGGHARAGHSEEPGQGAGRETELGHPKATKLRWEDRKHSADSSQLQTPSSQSPRGRAGPDSP